MTRKIFYQLIVFVVVFLAHMVYSVWRAIQTSKRWVQVEDTNWLKVYFGQEGYMLGISYALAVTFTIYALLKFFEFRKAGISGIVGGVTLTGILYVGGCFFLGCCGSPMLAIYLGLFGTSFLGFTKPLILTITVISVSIGYVWIEKKTQISTPCCIKGENCR